jgi:hypothetical protein
MADEDRRSDASRERVTHHTSIRRARAGASLDYRPITARSPAPRAGRGDGPAAAAPDAVALADRLSRG